MSALVNLFAPGLLVGRAIALGGAARDTIARSLESLGARVETVGELDMADEAVGNWARAHEPLDVLVFDAASAFGDGGPEKLLESMQEAWAAVREIAVGSLIASPRPGKIVLVGPRPTAGSHAQAFSAALENLARTVSVEWARHNVTAVMVAPGAGSAEAEVTQLICFLCSPAGDYFSGCRLDLGRGLRAG